MESETIEGNDYAIDRSFCRRLTIRGNADGIPTAFPTIQHYLMLEIGWRVIPHSSNRANQFKMRMHHVL